jgi:hypothetical protein
MLHTDIFRHWRRKDKKMTESRKFSQRLESYQPSKTLWFWSMAGAVVATMIIGFSFGGWTTAGTTEEMVSKAASDARAELVATICVRNFAQASDATEQLAALKDTSGYQRDDFIEEGGWAKVPGLDEAVPGAFDRCAEELVAMETLPATAPQAAVVGG